MTLLTSIKIFSDLCLYFAAAGGLIASVSQGCNPLWAILLCTGGVLVAAGLARRQLGLRLIGLAGPVLALATVGTFTHLLFLLPAVAYTAAVIAAGRFDLDRSRCREIIPRCLVGLGVLLVLGLLGMTDRSFVILYGGLYALSAFFLLRQLRLEHNGGWQSRGLNLMSLLVVIAGGGLLFLAVWSLFQLPFTIWNAIGWVFYLIAYILRPLFVAIEWLIVVLSALIITGKAEIPPMEFTPFETPLDGIAAAENPIAGAIFTCLLILILGLIAFFVIRRMMQGLQKPIQQVSRQRQIEHITIQERPRRSSDSSNRGKLRNSYRKFMKLLRSRGIELEPSLTTEEIHQASTPVADPDTAEALRGLYLTARYDYQTDVTSQQVREAKELLQRIKKEKKD